MDHKFDTLIWITYTDLIVMNDPLQFEQRETQNHWRARRVRIQSGVHRDIRGGRQSWRRGSEPE